MKKIYNKSASCYQTLLEELLKVLDGVNEGEIRYTLNAISDNFSIEELLAELSRHYILYDGFRWHFERVLEPYRNYDDQDNTPSAQFSEDVNKQADVPQSLMPDQSSGNKMNDAAKNAENLPALSASEPEITGLDLSGENYDGFKKELRTRLRKFKNVENINFTMDYQVEIYANEITDMLHEEIQDLRHQMEKRLPGLNLNINIRKDRRRKK